MTTVDRSLSTSDLEDVLRRNYRRVKRELEREPSFYNIATQTENVFRVYNSPTSTFYRSQDRSESRC
jgi:hypothetical protein